MSFGGSLQHMELGSHFPYSVSYFLLNRHRHRDLGQSWFSGEGSRGLGRFQGGSGMLVWYILAVFEKSPIVATGPHRILLWQHTIIEDKISGVKA